MALPSTISSSFLRCNIPSLPDRLSSTIRCPPHTYGRPARLSSPCIAPETRKTTTQMSVLPANRSGPAITVDGAFPSLSEVLLLLPRLEPSVHEQEALRIVATTAQSSGLEPRLFDRCRHAGVTFCSFCFPSCVSAERLAVVGFHFALMFLIDDLLLDVTGLLDPEAYGLDRSIYNSQEQTEEICRRLDAVSRSSIPPANCTPLERACWEVHQEMHRFCPPEWVSMLVDVTLKFLKSGTTLSWQKKLNVNANYRSWARDLEHYFEERLINAGVPGNLLYLELANDVCLPSQLRADPYIQKISSVGARHGVIINDLFSYHKEVNEGSDCNFLTMSMDTEGITLAQAGKRAMQILNDATRLFAEMEATFPTWESEATDVLARRYVEGVKQAMSNFVYWNIYTERYRSPDSLFPEMRA